MFLQETCLTEKKSEHWLRVKVRKIVYQANGPHKQVRVAILITDKVDLRIKLIRTDNEGQLILMK
jgi:hypothetical protein